MTDVSNLTYNGNAVTGVTFNGNTLTALHYSNIAGDEYKVEFGNTDFDLVMYCIASDVGTIKWSDSPSFTFNKTGSFVYFSMTGNTTCLLKPTRSVDLSKFTVTKNSFITFYTIDNYAFLINRNTGYNTWIGGLSSGAYTANKLSLNYNNTTTYESYLVQNIDEDNVVFNEGLYINKLIRIPSTGTDANRTNALKVWTYPFDFDSYDFMAEEIADNYVYLCNWNSYIVSNTDSVLNIKNGNLYDTNNVQVGTLANNTILNSLSISTSGLDISLEYSIGQNTTNQYREAALLIGNCMVHFLQEPASSTRIYYGYSTGRVDPRYLDRYNGVTDKGTTPTLYTDKYWDYLFQGNSSKVLTEDTSISNTEGVWYMLYPTNITDTYNISTSGSGSEGTVTTYDEEVVDEDTGKIQHTLIWGGIPYTLVSNIASTRTYNFIKK